MNPKFSVSHPLELHPNQSKEFINPQVQKTQSVLRNTAQNSLAQSEIIGSDRRNIHDCGLKWGSKEALSQTRHADHEFKHYDDFTKRFD